MMIGMGIPINHNSIPRIVLVSLLELLLPEQRWVQCRVPKAQSRDWLRMVDFSLETHPMLER
jgi:hypothetical protein